MAWLSTSAPDAERNSTDVLLRLDGVAKRYGGKLAIEVNRLEIVRGDAISFIGANGSGKSTLLRILAGVTRPSKGRVQRLGGVRTLRTVMVPQGGALYPSLTLLENIEVMCRLFGIKDYVDDRAIPGLYELGLNDLVDRRVGTLSGGYRRLATIAAAVAIAPGGLLIDEPFTALDPQKSQLLGAFLEKARERLQFIAVTGHDHDATADQFGRTIRCVDGKLLAEGA